MNEDALRALVRDTIARLESSRAERAGAAPGGESWATPQQLDESRLLHFIPHPSQYQYALP